MSLMVPAVELAAVVAATGAVAAERARLFGIAPGHLTPEMVAAGMSGLVAHQRLERDGEGYRLSGEVAVLADVLVEPDSWLLLALVGDGVVFPGHLISAGSRTAAVLGQAGATFRLDAWVEACLPDLLLARVEAMIRAGLPLSMSVADALGDPERVLLALGVTRDGRLFVFDDGAAPQEVDRDELRRRVMDLPGCVRVGSTAR